MRVSFSTSVFLAGSACLMLTVSACSPSDTVSTDAPIAEWEGIAATPEQTISDPTNPASTNDPATETRTERTPDSPVTDNPVTDHPVRDNPVEDSPVTDEPFPEGESPLDSNANTQGDGTDDTMNQAGTDPIDTPGVDEPDTSGNGIGEVPNTGWMAPTMPTPWSPVELAAYPHVLPQRPQTLSNANYQPWTSGRGVAEYQGKLYVASTEANSMVVIDAETGDVERIVAVGDRPEQVVVAPDGTAYVTVRYSGEVVRVLPGSSQIAQSVKVGTEPYGLALSVDAQTLYVSIAAENRVVALNASDLTPLSNIDVPQRPRGISASASGPVFVTNQYGSLIRIETDLSGLLLDQESLALRTENPVDTAMHQEVKNGETQATRAFGVSANPQTGVVYVAHVNANPGSTEQSLTELLNQETITNTECETTCQQTCKNSGGYGGTTCSNSCATNCVTETLTFPHLLRPIEATVSAFDPTGAGMPTESCAPVKDKQSGEPMGALCDKPMDVNHHPTWSLLFMVCKGTDNVMVLNTADVDPMRSPVAEIKVGHAPTAVTFSEDGTRAYVRNSQGFTISEVDLSPLFAMQSIDVSSAPSPGFNFAQFNPGQALTEPIQLVHQAEVAYAVDNLPEDIREGRRAFTFARSPGLAGHGFFACATCHFEGTEDGMVWFVKDGPRQTPLIAQKLADTGPFNWVGTAETLNDNIKNTVIRMGGSGLTEETIESLVSFLVHPDGLLLPPNPNVDPQGLTESQLAGKELFFHPTLGCAECHAGTGTTDGENWDVGTFGELEQQLGVINEAGPLALNTPSLRGLHYTAPYLHDGSVQDLSAMLNATSATMGVTIQLTGQQQQDLISYLLTL